MRCAERHLVRTDSLFFANHLETRQLHPGSCVRTIRRIGSGTLYQNYDAGAGGVENSTRLGPIKIDDCSVAKPNERRRRRAGDVELGAATPAPSSAEKTPPTKLWIAYFRLQRLGSLTTLSRTRIIIKASPKHMGAMKFFACPLNTNRTHRFHRPRAVDRGGARPFKLHAACGLTAVKSRNNPQPDVNPLGSWRVGLLRASAFSPRCLVES